MFRTAIAAAAFLWAAPAFASGICEYSWDERPGYADYTTYDAYLRSRYRYADRSQRETLQGDPAFKRLGFCGRAKRVKRCFDRVIWGSYRREAAVFRRWALRRGLDPVRAFMAKSAQETHLGALADFCRRGVCNGIGMAQIITAIAPDGRRLSVRDPRWSGITHNILTNLEYGLRVIVSKLPRSESLYDLAFHYNGHPANQRRYALDVVGYYSDLKRCGL
jgi:hypothetical protein